MPTTTTTPKPRRGRTAVPAPEKPTTAAPVLDAIASSADLHPDQAGFRSTTLLPVERLHPHPRNPRTDLGDLTELADSIRAHGVRQNLLVVPDPDGPSAYRIVIGHRRTAAATLAGVTHLPAVVDPSLTEADQLELMLLENLQRTDLSPVEEADGYQGLLDLGVDVATVAARTGRSETTVRSRLRLVPLPEQARAAVHRHEITLDDAAAIADLPEVDQAPLVKKLGTPSFRFELQKVRDRQKRDEMFAPVLDLLRAANATELQADQWQAPEGSVAYARFSQAEVTRLRDAETLAELEAALGPGWSWRWYYELLGVYRPFTLEEAQQDAAAKERMDATRAEREDRAQVERDARAARKQFATVTAAMRREFLEHLIHDRKSLTKDQTATVVDYAATVLAEGPWEGAYYDGVYRQHSVPWRADNADGLVEWLRIDLPDDYKDDYHRRALLPLVTAAAAALPAPQRLLAALAAGVEPITEDVWCDGGRSITTTRWYGLLEQLGYEVSDAERAALVVVPDEDDDELDDDGDV